MIGIIQNLSPEFGNNDRINFKTVATGYILSKPHFLQTGSANAGQSADDWNWEGYFSDTIFFKLFRIFKRDFDNYFSIITIFCTKFMGQILNNSYLC